MNLGGRIKQRRKELKMTQVALAEKAGVTQGIIANIEARDSQKSSYATKIASALGVRLEWLLTGEEPIIKPSIESNAGEIGRYRLWSQNEPLPEDEYVQVPFYKDVEFQGGAGRCPVEDYNGYTLAFSKATLHRQGVPPNQAVCITLTGDSMEPVMPSGTTCGINTVDKTIVDGKYYAINHGGLLRIKRLYRLPNNQLRINSINTDEYPDEVVDMTEVEVVGRLFHMSILL